MTPLSGVGRRILAMSVLLLIGLTGCGEMSPLLQGGVGTKDSEPFPLPGGRYALGWTASPQRVEGCELSVELRRAGDGTPVAKVSENFESAGARRSVESVGELSRGEYQLLGMSTCESWTAVVGEQPATAD